MLFRSAHPGCAGHGRWGAYAAARTCGLRRRCSPRSPPPSPRRAAGAVDRIRPPPSQQGLDFERCTHTLIPCMWYRYIHLTLRLQMTDRFLNKGILQGVYSHVQVTIWDRNRVGHRLQGQERQLFSSPPNLCHWWFGLGRFSGLTQEVMGSEGSVSGRDGGAYRLVRSKSLNFFPIKDSALSTCCWVPGMVNS